MTCSTIQDTAGRRCKKGWMQSRGKKVHGGEKKALQHHIKYPQLSSWIIDGWAAVVYWAVCTEKHPGILAGMSKHLPSQRCKLEPFTFSFLFFAAYSDDAERTSHSPAWLQTVPCHFIQIYNTADKDTYYITHALTQMQGSYFNKFPQTFNLTFWRIFPIQMQRISVKCLHHGRGGKGVIVEYCFYSRRGIKECFIILFKTCFVLINTFNVEPRREKKWGKWAQCVICRIRRQLVS